MPHTALPPASSTPPPPSWYWSLPYAAVALFIAAMAALLWLIHREDAEEQRAGGREALRLPGDGEPRFLINPFGMMFDEVTASNLIVVDMEGKVVAGADFRNQEGSLLHGEGPANAGPRTCTERREEAIWMLA